MEQPIRRQARGPGQRSGTADAYPPDLLRACGAHGVADRGTLVPVYGALLLVVLGMFMYLQNSASQVLYMDVASQSHPGSLNLAASLNSMSFNIGIALGSAVGGVVNGHVGLMWLGPSARCSCCAPSPSPQCCARSSHVNVNSTRVANSAE